MILQEWQKVQEILAPDGPDEEAEKRERLKEKSLELQRGWHDNKKVRTPVNDVITIKDVNHNTKTVALAKTDDY